MSRNPALDVFMAAFPHEGLTFDDVSLVTRFADFLPTETDLSTRFSARIRLNIPLVSAAMDTVTEARMAIAMAMLGGIGVVHRNLSVEDQARIVRTVKHHLNGLITQPVTFRSTDTLRTVRETRQARGYAFSGFPILDENDRLAGILTSADIKFARDPGAPVTDVMTQFCGGLRLAMGYVGCRSLSELQERAQFVRVTPAGVAEGHAHNVTITKEAPNYRT